jgi:hypothetical protein
MNRHLEIEPVRFRLPTVMVGGGAKFTGQPDLAPGSQERQRPVED